MHWYKSECLSWFWPTSVGRNSGWHCQARALKAMVHQYFLFLPKDPACSRQEPLVRQIPKWRSCRAKTKPFQDSYVIWAGKKKHFCCSVSRKELGSLVRAQLSLNWPVCLSVCLKCPLTSLGEGFHPSLKLTECDKPWIWKPNQWWDTFKSWCSALLVDLWLDKPYILLSTNLC